MTISVKIDAATFLAAACSYRASTVDGSRCQETAIAQAVAAGVDASTLLELFRRHRIQALALDTLERHQALAILGGAVDELRVEAAEVRRGALAGIATEARATKLLAAAGIECLPLKGGPRLSMQLYGDIGLRQSKDIDLVVPPGKFVEAVLAFQAAGWSPKHEVWMSSPGHRWLAPRILRDFPLRDPATGTEVELHHRFERIASDRLDKIWREGYREPSHLRPSDAEFCYLAMHGALHGWNRLKWLGDIVAVLERRPGVFRDVRPLAARLGLVPAFDHLAGLVSKLHGIVPEGFEDRDLGAASVEADVDFCLRRILDADPADGGGFGKAFARIRLDLHRQELFAARIPWKNRLAHVAWSVAVRPEDVERLGGARGWAWRLPWCRLASLLRRYLGGNADA